jgi:hypothetical protein
LEKKDKRVQPELNSGGNFSGLCKSWCVKQFLAS